MWARTDMAVDFFPARDAILDALKQGPMTLPMLVRKTDKKMRSIKSELHLHLVPKGKVIRTRYGVYALPGTAPQYVSNKDAIIAALKNGPMTRQALASEVGSTPLLLQQFIDSLLAKGTIIRTKRGVYALPGTAPVYVTTSDAIVSALTKNPMKMDALVRHVNRSRAMIHRVLLRLKEQGTVKQDRRGGEYRLVRRACAMRGQAGQRRRS
jgi:predicted transcriptional regulator